MVFSAHGVAPAVRAEAARRKLTVVDATCPLVAKVHTEARRFIARGDTVLLIGHDGHDETEGTLGEAPGQIRLVQSPAEAELVAAADPSKVAVLTQTTLAVEDANQVVDVLRRRFPLIESPPTEDICYATTNRQDAVRAIADESDLVLVVGSQNSSNSLRLVEVAERAGVRAHLVDDAAGILPEWLEDARTVGHHRRCVGPAASGRRGHRHAARSRPGRGRRARRHARGHQVHAPQRGGRLMAGLTPAIAYHHPRPARHELE